MALRFRACFERRSEVNFGYIRKGLAIHDQEMGVILASGNANKRAFERQLAKALWERTTPGVKYTATAGSPRWYAPNPVPERVEPQTVTPVYVLMVVGGDIAHIHWTANKKKAQIAFRKAGYKVIG